MPRRVRFWVGFITLLFLVACSESPTSSASDTGPRDAPQSDLGVDDGNSADGKEADVGADVIASDVALPDDCTDPSAFQTDGSFTSVTEAIRQAEQAGGGVVCVPAGDFDWGAVKEFLMAGGVSLIGAGAEHSTIRWDGNQLFVVNKPGDQPGPFRVSGLTFHPKTKGKAFKIQNIEDFRIDNCTFVCPELSYMVNIMDREGYPRSHGVVDHCTFTATGPHVYGVTTGPSPWPEKESRIMHIGTKQAVFIEDCTFEGLYHSAAAFNGGHYVLRHNTFKNPASPVDGHGPTFVYLPGDTEKKQARGTRCVEIYNNSFTWTGDRGHTPIRIRGGGGVIFGNTITNAKYPLILVMESGSHTASNGVYPCQDQIHEMWIWDNTENDVLYELRFEGPDAQTLIQQDRDFFLRAPTQADDGLSYTAYQYPHPLTK